MLLDKCRRSEWRTQHIINFSLHWRPKLFCYHKITPMLPCGFESARHRICECIDLTGYSSAFCWMLRLTVSFCNHKKWKQGTDSFQIRIKLEIGNALSHEWYNVLLNRITMFSSSTIQKIGRITVLGNTATLAWRKLQTLSTLLQFWNTRRQHESDNHGTVFSFHCF